MIVSPAAHVHGQQQPHAMTPSIPHGDPQLYCFQPFEFVYLCALVRSVPWFTCRALSSTFAALYLCVLCRVCTLNPQTAGAWLVPPPAPCLCDFGVLRKTKPKYREDIYSALFGVDYYLTCKLALVKRHFKARSLLNGLLFMNSA